MPAYQVTFERTTVTRGTMTIEADSQDAARRVAMDTIASPDLVLDDVYDLDEEVVQADIEDIELEREEG